MLAVVSSLRAPKQNNTTRTQNPYAMSFVRLAPPVAGLAISVTASGFLVCPGVASLRLVPQGLVEVLVPLRGSLCPAGWGPALFGHCVTAIVPVPREAGCGLVRPRALRPHTPPPATGGRDPRRGPSAFAGSHAAVSPTRLARPVPAGFGAIGHPRHRRLKPPTLRLEASKLGRKCSGDRGAQAGRWQSGRAEVSPPRGR